MEVMEPNHIMRDTWNRRSSRSSSHGLERGPTLNSRSRRGMGESAEEYRRCSAQRCLTGMDEPEEGEIIGESKRGRYSNHGNKENFTDSLEQRHYSRDRLPQMHQTHYSEDRHPQIHGTVSTDDVKHERHKRPSPCHNFSKGTFQGGSAVEYADHAASHKARRLIKYDSRERVYCRRDSEHHYRCYSSFPKGLPHDQPDCRPCDRKHFYDAARLPRNNPRFGDRDTFKESHRSFRQKPNDDKFHMETSNSLSWNGPKWGEETIAKDASNFAKWKSDNNLSWSGPKWGEEIIEDAPNSSKWRSDDVTHGCDKDVGDSFPWSGPKWGEETNTKSETNFSPWKSGADTQGNNEESDNGFQYTNSKQGDEAHIKDEPSSWKLTTTRWGSNETKNSSSWDDRAIAKDTKSSWHGPKWGDKMDTKDTPSSRRSSNIQRASQETISCSWNGPKWNDESTTKDTPSSHRLRPDANKWDSNGKSDNGLSWNGPKWGDEPRTKDATSSWRSLAKWGYKEPSNSSPLNDRKWDDIATKDAPDSPKWKLDADGSDVKLDDSLSWKGPKWGDRQSEDASISSGWKTNASREDSNVDTDKSLSWTGLKWGYQTTGKSMCNSYRCRLDDDKQPDNVETQKASRNDPKWDDNRTAKDAPKASRWGSDVGKRHITVKTDICSSLDGLKWGDRSNIKDSPDSSWHWSDGDRKQYNVEANNRRSEAVQGAHVIETCNKSSRSGPKWNDQTTMKDTRSFTKKLEDAKNHCFEETENSSMLNNLTSGDEISKKDASSPYCKSNGDPQVLNVEANNSMLCNGPKQGSQLATKDAPFASGCRPKQVYNEEPEKTYWQDSKQGDLVAAKDAPEPSRHSSDDGKGEYHLNIGNSFPLDVPNAGVKIITEISPSFSRQSSDNIMDHGVKADSSLAQNRLDCGDQMITQEAYKGALSSDEQNITRETSGKDQHVLNKLQSPSSISDLCEEKGLEGESLNNSGQSQFTSRHEALDQQMEHSISTNGQDKMPKLPSHGQGLESDWHGHLVGICKQSQLPANLKSFTTEAYATATVHIQPCLGYPSTETITIDASHLKDSAIQTKSQATPKNLVSPSGAQGELFADTVIETIKRKTGRSKDEETASLPNLADSDTRNAGEISKDGEKGIRMFKFAVAEFAKDVIKPYWKEGRLNKEAYKTVVKKVVDKVIGTMQVADLPQTQKNIDLYIYYSKAKLTNLVWAYLEKHAKSQSGP